MKKNEILILDFGSQYTQLIARSVREQKVFSRIMPFNVHIEAIKKLDLGGIILSGGPCNVYQRNAPLPDERIFDLGIPVLGICYGMQYLGHQFKGHVKKTDKREYGYADLLINSNTDLFYGLPKKIQCWMSHGDHISRVPNGFERIAHTKSSTIASIRSKNKLFYGVQFHPEVKHTPLGKKIISNFLFRICKLRPDWTPRHFITQSIEEIREKVGKGKVVLGLSGGVDSSVAAILLHKAIGRRLTCIFVDNGVLRKGESKKLREVFKRNFKINLKMIDAERGFLRELKGITDPEAKRKAIGHEFIRVFQREAKKIGKVDFLAQGTLYPDVIESVSFHGGPTATIKSHHNVGGLPKKMKLKLVEPLRELFKDEVRLVGRTLGLPSEVVDRQPFPGPGLAVRILGEVTKMRCDLLREADAIVLEEIKKAGLYKKIWQSFAVLLPINSVGVMGDERTYENVCAIRAVYSSDGMTADWVRLPEDVLARISNRIINEARGINRVCYDISSKPPATIEWE
ncbi:MAG: glutamine-hydrolyzing GMP synthase [Candidatus Omnitrophica bacterium]|nr:glutamine-hydrolyzing GMP synthase [Candidatus Omnitrophota bacterium]